MGDVQARFLELAERLGGELRGEELLLVHFAGERSDFVRFNRGRVRQAGSVEQQAITLRLVLGRRQASATATLGAPGEDLATLQALLARLREIVATLPEDPWLLVSRDVRSSSSERRGTLAPAEAVVEAAVRAAHGLDLVGIYAAGTVYRGFANSLGQRNWHEVDSFNFDWSVYREADQAVKAGYAGFDWDAAAFADKVQAAARESALFARPRRSLAPGSYRAYLGPRALEEIVGLLAWGGFSARARATKQSPLLLMEQGARLSPKITLVENTAAGVAPAFQAEGFVKPPRVELVRAGALGEALVSPRSAREFGLETNGANAAESPQSLELAPGALAADDVAGALGEGLYISNLWYLNYSDRPAGRLTGMTRFATFWVEGGRIAAPVAPMRFDDSLYRILGEQLLDLTRERELLLDSSTYEGRSTASARLPGALVGDFRLTL